MSLRTTNIVRFTTKCKGQREGAEHPSLGKLHGAQSLNWALDVDKMMKEHIIDKKSVGREDMI